MILYHSGVGGSKVIFEHELLPEIDMPTDDAATLLLRGRHRLVSFARYVEGQHSESDIAKLAQMHEGIALDSGAYSVAQGTLDIDINQYSEFLKRHEHHFDFVANLDVLPIGGVEDSAERSAENQRALEKLGHKPLPCFHVSEPWGALEDMVESYEHLALGGLAGLGTAKQVLTDWLDDAFSRIPKTHRVHGFGIGNEDMIRHYPWHSVDSTVWLAAARYGKWPPFQSGVYSLTSRTLVWLEYLEAIGLSCGEDYERAKGHHDTLFSGFRVDRKREKNESTLGPVEQAWPQRSQPVESFKTTRYDVLLLGYAPRADSDAREPLSGYASEHAARLMGISLETFMELTPRATLLQTMPNASDEQQDEARDAAVRVLKRTKGTSVLVVALGWLAGESLGVGEFTFFDELDIDGTRVVVVPDVGSRTLEWWDEAANLDKAKEFFEGLAAGARLPATLERKQEPKPDATRPAARKAPPVDPAAQAAMQARMRAVLDSQRERAKQPEQASVLGAGTNTIGRCTCCPVRGRHEACPVHGGMR